MFSKLRPAVTTQPLFIDKYRPYYLSDFENNEIIPLKTIRAFLNINDLNLLFIGSSCSGKTTLLHAIIREYYGLSKNDPFSESYIMVINNLKEQGINFFRNEMKTFCQSCSPIHGKKKIILVDDIDLVNEQSQQVFRNYMDKYHSNVHFLTSCTNVQKVIESLQSRLHIINLTNSHNLSDGEDGGRNICLNVVQKIIAEEKLNISESAKEHILNSANHSPRNVVNQLEKIYLYANTSGQITAETCEKLCSTISFAVFKDYIEKLKGGNLADAIRILYDIHDFGYSVIDIYEFFFSFIKNTEIIGEEAKYLIFPILCKYITIFHNVHEDCIELALFTNEISPILQSNSGVSSSAVFLSNVNV